MNPNLPWWLERLSVAQRFLLGSLIILVAGMAGVGAWVSQQIVDGVIHRTASTTALYVDSLIAPSLQDLSSGDTLSTEAKNRLDWLFADTPLGSADRRLPGLGSEWADRLQHRARSRWQNAPRRG